MTYENFCKGMTIVEVCLQKQMDDKQLKIYFKLLQDIPDIKFGEGIKRLMQERVYTNIPSPAEIREFCLGYKERDLIVKAAEAKQKLKNTIAEIGAYETIVFDDPVLHLIVQDLGGWIKTCGLSEKELEDYFKFKYENLYKSYATRQNSSIPLKLKGIHEKEEITYIGDSTKAIEWTKKFKEKYKEIEIPEGVKMIGDIAI